MLIEALAVNKVGYLYCQCVINIVSGAGYALIIKANNFIHSCIPCDHFIYVNIVKLPSARLR